MEQEGRKFPDAFLTGVLHGTRYYDLLAIPLGYLLL